jgi:3-hydroxybutyryl-CoA dehydrogenase
VAEPPVAVVGAGLMGSGIAACFAAAGHEVAVHDPVAESLAAAPQRVAAALAAMSAGADDSDADPEPRQGAAVRGPADAGRGSERDDAVALARVRYEPRPQDAVAGAGFVFEAAPEDLTLKQEIFARLDAIAAPGCILASNSSALRPTEIFARAEHPGRTVGTHWWNPPHLVPLVEVVRGERTSDETVERTFDLLAAVGKVPVRVDRDVPGFVGNRLQHALWREAFQLVDEGVCDAETIDTVVKNGFGPRLAVLGPMENADLVGLELTLSIHDYLLPRLTPPSEPSAGLRERIAAGHAGMGAGEGWRRWPEGSRDEVQALVSRHLRAAAAKRSSGGAAGDRTDAAAGRSPADPGGE